MLRSIYICVVKPGIASSPESHLADAALNSEMCDADEVLLELAVAAQAAAPAGVTDFDDTTPKARMMDVDGVQTNVHPETAPTSMSNNEYESIEADQQFDRNVKEGKQSMHPVHSYTFKHLIIFCTSHVGLFDTNGQKKKRLKDAVVLLGACLARNRVLWKGRKLILNPSQPTNIDGFIQQLISSYSSSDRPFTGEGDDTEGAAGDAADPTSLESISHGGLTSLYRTKLGMLAEKKASYQTRPSRQEEVDERGRNIRAQVDAVERAQAEAHAVTPDQAAPRLLSPAQQLALTEKIEAEARKKEAETLARQVEAQIEQAKAQQQLMARLFEAQQASPAQQYKEKVEALKQQLAEGLLDEEEFKLLKDRAFQSYSDAM